MEMMDLFGNNEKKQSRKEVNSKTDDINLDKINNLDSEEMGNNNLDQKTSDTKERLVNKGSVNRKYKDRLFQFIFGKEENKKYLLSLYNAINGTFHMDPNDIEITTLDDVLYIKMKNDLSFILDGYLSLYEHQSTLNPNMPLRGLFYFSELYKRYAGDSYIYGMSLIKIPTPKYIVFYNGKKNCPDVFQMKLSDAFENGSSSGSLEVIATVYNINYGHNKKMMRECAALREYSLFVHAVRHYLQETDLESAIDRAIDYAKKFKCIGEYLIKNKREVRNMLFTEFDQEKYDQVIREESEKNGEIKYAVKLIKRGKLTLEEAAKDFNMSVQDLEKIMKSIY